MSDEPDPKFAVRDAGVAAVAGAYADADVHSLVDAFAAALLAPTWRALIDGGALQAPADVDITRVEIRPLSSTRLELSVPVRLGDGEEITKTLTVRATRWTASGEIVDQLGSEARNLAIALQAAYEQRGFDHDGPRQKPHN